MRRQAQVLGPGRGALTVGVPHGMVLTVGVPNGMVLTVGALTIEAPPDRGAPVTGVGC